MKVYVSCPSSEMRLVHDVMRRVREAGHEVPHDWTEDMDREPEMEPTELAQRGSADLLALCDVDMLVAVVTSAGGPTPGVAAEIGAAILAGTPFILVELVPMENGPWERHPIRCCAKAMVGSIDAAIGLMR